MHKNTGAEPTRLEGGSVRADGTVRKVVKVKQGWVGDLEVKAYQTRGKQDEISRQSCPVGGKLVHPEPVKKRKEDRKPPPPNPTNVAILQSGASPEEARAKLVAKELAKVRQKLKEIRQLEEKATTGQIDENQKAKMAKKVELENSLANLLQQQQSLKAK
eukprot:TRINITY_DN11604_c0_g1_i3.p1 TRINITY_DN11604_c0_g1~~TRINITY_DN11604_c0_g1_i3.p1  ORF type:complete len:160 (-),score=46.85 TRINITY_DN11604_c0_g1_i3:19-498(-)